jgi:divalent metal cation (Fe/Co/Zn/Cd) transporter
MNPEIELLDRKWMNNLAWSLLGSTVFIVLSVARFFLRQSGLNSEPIGQVVLAGLLISLLILVASTIESYRLGRKLREEPFLAEALHNELIRTIETQSWKAAFLGAITVTVFFAVVWFFYPVCDPIMVALTSIVTGSACYQGNIYFKYRSL